ncbi:hypothetical protein [Micromonospora sp. NPDC005305]|uniref:hypothetical protein n=1 Tax=Micromonospora sp. NPDC005305 TaxID=3156875 RepID=UPI0033A0102A
MTAELVDGALVLRFDRACPIGYLRLTMPPREGETDPRLVWEILAEEDAPWWSRSPSACPPDGFREKADNTPGRLPGSGLPVRQA